MAVENVTSVVVAIDTDQYSGNFEREMCAFVTGQIGECGVGKQFVDGAQEELSEIPLNTVDGESIKTIHDWIDCHIAMEMDDRRCERPASIWPTPGRVNNGRGRHFNESELKKESCWAGTHWPAYESVAIFFDEVPPKEVLDVIAARAKHFAENRPDLKPWHGKKIPLKLLSIRVLEPKRKKEMIEVIHIDEFGE